MLTPLPAALDDWPLDIAQSRFSAQHHGDYPKWLAALKRLPEMHDPQVGYGDTVEINGDVDEVSLEDALRSFHPWRKGPFGVGRVHIDTEWRSDWKWARMAPTLQDMSGQRVLDIGCGNGYFGWRMLAQGAAEVVGIDPTLLFCMQHLAIQHYTRDSRNWVLPLKIEEIPNTATFDTVVSMGVIYHRREPAAHVAQMAALTAPGGRLLLESLVVEAPLALVPESRYARMRNVWCVPTTEDLCNWLRAAGCVEVAIIDVCATTTSEQRSTDWMRFESLAAALDPQDPRRTIEGYPAPVRAMVTGRKPT